MSLIIDKIVDIFKSSIQVTELEERVEFSFKAGIYNECWECLQGLLENGGLNIIADDEFFSAINEISELRPEDVCRAQINKAKMNNFGVDFISESENLLFFTSDGFDQWLKNCPDPFNTSHPFYRGSKLVIWLSFADHPVIGEALSFLPIDHQGDIFQDLEGSLLPCDGDIRSVVNFVTSDSVKVDPVRFKLPVEKLGDKCVNIVYRWYSEMLCCCLVKEFYGRHDLVISGVKRVSFRLSDDDFYVSKPLIEGLENTVKWAFLAHPSTRLMLLMERLSLDLNPQHAVLPLIFDNLDKSLQQAKHKYEYVIKDRREEHAKEVSELQKDIKNTTDGFSSQAIMLISGTLRDSLYALMVVAVGLLARVIGNTDILESSGFALIFKALALYLVVSAMARALVGWKTLILSRNDLYKWKEAVRNHLSHEEVSNHIKDLTSPYVLLYLKCGFFVFFLHIALAFFVWNVPIFIDTGFLSTEVIEE